MQRNPILPLTLICGATSAGTSCPWRIRILQRFLRLTAQVLENHDSEIQRRIEVPGPYVSSVNQYGVGHQRTMRIPLINLVVD